MVVALSLVLVDEHVTSGSSSDLGCLMVGAEALSSSQTQSNEGKI